MGRQRDFVATLCCEASFCPDSPDLALGLTFLTAWLLSHMADEERGLGSPGASVDDFVMIAQQVD